jgi:hypothetical protein
MILRQTLPHSVNGYWDGGAKQVFDWEIEHHTGTDAKGTFVRIGCFGANHWFNVSQSKTDKLTLCNAIKHLRATQIGKQSKFEYILES